jgi:hypothetical protein
MSTIVNKITIGDGELLIFETGGTQIENDNTNKMLPFIFDIPLRKLNYITSVNEQYQLIPILIVLTILIIIFILFIIILVLVLILIPILMLILILIIE